MKKYLIGIFPVSNFDESLTPPHYTYTYGDLYGAKIFKCGGTPIGIILNNNRLEMSSLDCYDGFIIPGGNNINPDIYKLIHYALANNKPILGICMGMQALGIYSKVMSKLNAYDEVSFNNMYLKIKKENNNQILSQINENNVHSLKSDIIYHDIKILPNTLLNEIYNTDTMNVISFHKMCLDNPGNLFKISAMTNDIIEAIEHVDTNSFALALQYHAEKMSDDKIFLKFMEEVKKRCQK